jgi:hypothetical protein
MLFPVYACDMLLYTYASVLSYAILHVCIGGTCVLAVGLWTGTVECMIAQPMKIDNLGYHMHLVLYFGVLIRSIFGGV